MSTRIILIELLVTISLVLSQNMSAAKRDGDDIVKTQEKIARTVKQINEYGLGGVHAVTKYVEKNSGNATAFYPTDIKKLGKVPVIFFAPGWGATNPNGYKSLLNFIASHGYMVIYSRDQQSYSAKHFLDSFEQMLDKNNKIINYIDKNRFGVIGHSSGGGDSFKILDYFSKHGYGKNGRFLLALDPWFAFDMTSEAMQNLPKNSNIVIIQFGRYGGTDPRIVLTEYKLLTSIPAKQKDYQVYPGASHSYPTGNRPYKKMQGMLKTLDALMDYTFNGNPAAYKTALAVGSDNPVEDGLQGVKPIEKYPYRCNSHANENNKLAIDYCSIKIPAEKITMPSVNQHKSVPQSDN